MGVFEEKNSEVGIGGFFLFCIFDGLGEGYVFKYYIVYFFFVVIRVVIFYIGGGEGVLGIGSVYVCVYLYYSYVFICSYVFVWVYIFVLYVMWEF